MYDIWQDSLATEIFALSVHPSLHKNEIEVTTLSQIAANGKESDHDSGATLD